MILTLPSCAVRRGDREESRADEEIYGRIRDRNAWGSGIPGANATGPTAHAGHAWYANGAAETWAITANNADTRRHAKPCTRKHSRRTGITEHATFRTRA